MSMNFGARCGLAIATLICLMFPSAAVIAASPKASQAPQTLRVGPYREFVLPSIAAQFAKNGDTIEIDAGIYDRDAAVWKQNNLTIRGVGGMVHLDSRGTTAQHKGIWVLRGNNTTIENIEFSGARVPDRNGAGIRLEGAGLTVRNSFFHNNENGILCGANPQAIVVVEHSEFAHNGHGDGQSHNIYCGPIQSLTMRFNYIHHAKVGHNIKSRAARNLILYNRIGDEDDGNSSYAIDLPNGGLAILLGNIIQKGPKAENRTLISFGAESYKHTTNDLHVVNNTLVNEHPIGRFIFVRNAPALVTVSVINNLYTWPGELLSGNGQATHNLAAKPADFRNVQKGDYRLSPKSRAVGAGKALGMVEGISLVPDQQYRHKSAAAARTNARGVDLGALEAE